MFHRDRSGAPARARQRAWHATLALACGSVPGTAGGADNTLYGRLDLGLTHEARKGWSMTQASTSRLGVRGAESLGGGVTVLVRLEGGFDADAGGGPFAFRRESWIGLRGAWGTLRAGRSQSPSQRVASQFDPHGTDGIGSFGSAALLLGHGAVVRLQNAVWIDSAARAGVSLAGGYQLGEGEGDSPWSLSLRRQTQHTDVAFAAADAGGAGNRLISIGLAGRWGALQPMLQWHRGRRDGARAAGGLVGAVLEVPTGRLRVAASRLEQPAREGCRDRKAALGHDLDLSRRTVLHATLARTASCSGGQTSAPVAAGEVGLRHMF